MDPSCSVPVHMGFGRPPRASPHTRGWTTTRSGAPFRRAASPHTRGWTLIGMLSLVDESGFPAHAGMDPASPGRDGSGERLPRTRGDGPVADAARDTRHRASPHTRGWTVVARHGGMFLSGFPAHAGMDPTIDAALAPIERLPRTRGDGPQGGRRRRRAEGASPHTRGWTPADYVLDDADTGFPAHAGMDPGGPAGSCRRQRLPRTRGDGPCAGATRRGRSGASPHTRGWTLDRRLPHQCGRGFPAHAGMDPRWTHRGRSAGRLPRTRGDGPGGFAGYDCLDWASPHTRGWTLARHPPPAPRVGFPAHAGMDP